MFFLLIFNLAVFDLFTIIFYVVVLGLDHFHAMQLAVHGIDVWLQHVPDGDRQVFARSDPVFHEIHVQVHVLVVELVGDVLLDDTAQVFQVHEKSCSLVGFALHGYEQLVIMPVPVRVGAFAENLQVLFLRPVLAEQLMGRVKTLSSGDKDHAANIRRTYSVKRIRIFAPGMKILLVSATEKEISPLLAAIGVKNYVGDHLRICKYRNLDIDVLVTGIGMTATAFWLGKILSGKYEMAFNFGLAGSFNADLPVGCVVNIVQEHFSELGAEDGEQQLSLKEMGLEGASEVMNGSKIANRVLEEIPMVCGITVNKVHGNERTIEKDFLRFRPNTESMEGAAFLFACTQEKIPCAQVRCISNMVERRNRDNWNIPLAIENLNKKAVEILNAF